MRRLCSAPLPIRGRNFVVAKYLCYLILFAGCFVLYSIIAALYQEIEFAECSQNSLLVFLVGTSLLWTYIRTVAMKDGIAKARYVISVILLLMVLVPFGISSIFHHDLTSVMQFISNQSRAVLPVILGCVSALLFFIFMFASIHCFEKKEL
jgi:ABC-2 type transport system permease protein